MPPSLASAVGPWIQRRQLLAAAVAGLAPLPAASVSDAQASEPFPLGIASGSPAADGFVLWTRLAPETDPPGNSISIEWEVWPDGFDPADAVRLGGTAFARRELGYSVHVTVEGLRSNQWYRYRFRVGSHSSEVGRARTLPGHGQDPGALTICVASCQRWEDGHYAAYRHMANEKPDYVLFLGDYIYEYAGKKTGVRSHAEPHIVDLNGYRRRYALYKSDPALRAIHAECTWIITPDDHDVEDNYIGDRSEKNTPNFPERKRIALQAFYENMPVRLSESVALDLLGRTGGLPVHQRFQVGRLAGMHVLDTRQFRSWPAPPLRPGTEVPAAAATNPEPTMLGNAQEQWLADSLRSASQAGSGWNLIAMQSRFTPGNYAAGRGRRFGADTWDAYASARDRLLASVAAANARGVIFLGGDIHQFWVAHVHRDPYDVSSDVLGFEFCGTSVSSAATRDVQASRRSQQTNPHCVLADPSRRGYISVKMTTERLQVALRQVSNVADPESPLLTLAQFHVQRDGRGLRLERVT